VGRGVGPALEARDVLAVLRGEAGAPRDLRERALVLSGRVLELSPRVEAGRGEDLARALLDDGRAWRKLEAICDAQGGRREPPRAGHVHEVTADRPGVVAGLDCRRFARIAKLAGAPEAKAAGVDLLVVRGQGVEPGQPLYAIHAETPGELEYALAYARSQGDILDVREPS
jgi:thymidine phosphorylase